MNILFQSAASWTWSHTYLSVPCIVPASSAVRQSVSSDHNLPGAQHTNKQKNGPVKVINKIFFLVCTCTDRRNVTTLTCFEWKTKTENIFSKPLKMTSRVARMKCNEISTRSKSSIRPSFFSRSEFLLFSIAVSFSIVRSDYRVQWAQKQWFC